MNTDSELLEDRKLVDQCLAGDPLAWDDMYRLHHDRLLFTIRGLTFGPYTGCELVDEIAARVWFSVVDDGCRLLKRFDPDRGSRLIAFLIGIAKYETLNFFRSERRRKKREKQVSRDVNQISQSPFQQRSSISDFSELLTPGEQNYLDFELDSHRERHQRMRLEFSDTSRWQFRSRIQKKLRAYVNDI